MTVSKRSGSQLPFLVGREVDRVGMLSKESRLSWFSIGFSRSSLGVLQIVPTFS